MADSRFLQDIVRRMALDNNSAMTDKAFLEAEIREWKKNGRRQAMVLAHEYYEGRQDILKRKREVIGPDGALVEVHNLPNNRIVDNQYAKMVDQKKNYLVGKPLTFDTDDKAFADALKTVFDMRFQRIFKGLAESSINSAIAWLMPYYDENGEFRFKRFEGFEVLPFWRDSEHTQAQVLVRLYDVDVYEGNTKKTVEKVEVFTQKGIYRFNWVANGLVEDTDTPVENYLHADGRGWNWERIPLVPFKSNGREITLLSRVKPLQDGLNLIVSDFQNNMQEDPRNTILILENYDGENLAEFRKNLATYGAVKVRTVDGVKGGVHTLEINVNAENYKALCTLFKNAIVENARGYDAKDERMANNPNQMNIQSMYSEIDLDANDMETEWQASFEELLWFVRTHLKNTGRGDFFDGDVNVIFNRDMLVNETEAITNCRNSEGILSRETILAQHPWVSDTEKELARLKAEEEKARANMPDLYGGAFRGEEPPDGDGEGDAQ